MECGTSCNLLPLSSTWHHRQGSPLHFLDRLVTERARKTWTQGHDRESCCSFCWEDMRPWPVTPYMWHERESAREVTMCHRRAVTGCPTTSRIYWTVQVMNLYGLLVKWDRKGLTWAASSAWAKQCCFVLTWRHTGRGPPAFPQVYVKSYQATAGGSSSVLGNHRVFSRVRI